MINEDEIFPDRSHLVAFQIDEEMIDDLNDLVRKGVFATRTAAILTAIDQVLGKNGISEPRVKIEDFKIENKH